MSNLSNVRYNAEGGFCEGGGGSSQRAISGDGGRPAGWTDCHIPVLCVSISSCGSIVKAGQPDPTSGIQPSSLPCMHVSFLLRAARDFIVPSPPPSRTRPPECYSDQGKIIICPFVLATSSTGENKLMVMNPYH